VIFSFPDLETLRIALTSGQVPPAVALAPAEVSFDAEGRPSVKVHAIPPRAMQNALKRMGVTVTKAHAGTPQEVGSWPGILPVVKLPGTPELSPSAPVLFELPAAQLPSFATEMLRLGNDRQSFRPLDPSGDAKDSRVLLRVIGPPYYTLLRALDHLNADVAAYVEKAPRVWVEVGCDHPLAAHLKVPEGRLLLLRPPRRWANLEDGPFHDIYEVLDFQLPSAPVDYEEGRLQGKLTVPLRLAPGNAAEVPEMWVVRENAVEVFDAFVRDADDRLMARLMFAVAENGDSGPAIVLRTRPSKLAPPAVEIAGAAGFVPYKRLNNLFLPAGTRLQPTLRRDAVRQMLADDPAQVVWLTPLGNGRFVPETLPDEAFRPLQDWIDYVIDSERQALQSWVQATGFDFESFVCKDDAAAERPKPPPGPKPKTRKPGDRSADDADDELIDQPEPTRGKKKPAKSADEEAFAPAEVAAPPNELKIRREELEKEFLAIDGPLEAPERLALWPKLAAVNAGLGDLAEASVCWLNGLWERDELPAEWLRAWLNAEAGKDGAAEPTATAIDQELKRANATQHDARRLIAMLLLACARPPVPEWLRKRLPEVRNFLERNEPWVAVRAVWLAWHSVARVSGDVLGLARVRDRLVERLLETGLNKERDVPRFVRFSGRADNDRLRGILERAHRLQTAARKWVHLETPAATSVNGAYIDLMFAFGFASLGEVSAARDLVKSAESVLTQARDSAGERDEAHQLLLAGLRFRTEQAIDGKPHRGRLPAEWRDAFNRYAERVANLPAGNDSRKIGPYIVERFQEQSWIMEPEENLNPYRSTTQKVSDLNREVVTLAGMKDPAALASRIKKLLFEQLAKPSPELKAGARAELAADILPLCPRIGADFTRQALDRITPLVEQGIDAAGKDKSDDQIHLPGILARLIERALVLAVNYDAPELVKRFAGLFDRLLDVKSDDSLYKVINVAATRCIRSLRKNGMRDEIHALLVRMDAVLKGRTAKSGTAAAAAKSRVDVFCARLQVAGAWMYLGDSEQALRTMDEVREYLFGNVPGKGDGPPHQDYSRLARAYVTAVSNGPIDFAMDRIEEMFRKLAKVANSFTTSSHFSRLHLNVIEEVIAGVMQPESTLSETARRFLDDDEYLVRRRIHADMKRSLSQSGV
jgi:hypothetical protein